MQHDLIDRVGELLNTILTGAGDDTSSAETAGRLALTMGTMLLERGELDRARNLFTVAGQHLEALEQRRALAEQILLLAKAQGKRKGGEGTAGLEGVLEEAASLAPELALPALAQHYEQQRRLPEAIDRWRAAIRLSPKDGQCYFGLARTYERAERPEEALRVYMDLIEAVPSAKNFLIVAQRLAGLEPRLPEPRAQQRVRIALLGNATLDHVRSHLQVECFRAGLRPEIFQAGFDQYTQELLNPESSLYTFAPDILILAIHGSRLFPQIHSYPFDLTIEERRAEINAGLHTVENLLTTFTERCPAMVLLHNVVAPQYPAIGVADLRDDFGQTLVFNEINAQLAEMVRRRFHNVYIVDEDRVQAKVGKSRATDPRLWLTARMGWSEALLPHLAREYLRYLMPYKAMGRKCIVVDLDNTLWGGVVGEDGVAGVQVGADAPGNAFAALQRELERFWRRGILLAIASKNNPGDALAVFEQHPGMILKLSHFAAHRINWAPKADSLREIAEELNIGLDSLVFLDDNPVERAKIRAELPQVLTPEMPTDPAQYRNALLELTVFDSLGLTDEDRRRNQLYADQRSRRSFESERKSSESLDDYLADLQMVVEIATANDVILPRIAQLTNKTNQFNLTTRRYSEARIKEMEAQGHRVYSARVTDRFGDNGVVGVVIVDPTKPETWEIDTLLLSCRVMGRGVESALLAFLAEEARRAGACRLQGWYLPTPKNTPAKDCYRQHGWTLVTQDGDGGELWQVDLEVVQFNAPPWLSVRSIGS